MNNSSNLPPSTCTCHLPNKVKKSIQWMLFDSEAEKSTLAVDRLQSLLQKSLTFEVSYKKLTLLH